MLLTTWLSITFLCAYGGRIGVPGNLVSKLEKDVEKIKFNAPLISTYFENLKEVESFPSENLYIDGHNLRLSEEFVELHQKGIPSNSYGRNQLVKNLENSEFWDGNYRKWEYGESRILRSSSYVKMQEALRDSPLHPWKEFQDVERMVNIKVTKRMGPIKPNGGRKRDIYVIEEITDLLGRRPVTDLKPIPSQLGFKNTDEKTKLIKVNDPTWQHEILNSILRNQPKFIKTYDAPNFKILQGHPEYTVRVSEFFFKTHTLGKPPGNFKITRLVKDIGDVEFWDGQFKKHWNYGESRILRSSNYVKMKQARRASSENLWSNFEDIQGFLSVKARKYMGARNQNGDREKDILVLEEITQIILKLPDSPTI